MRDVQAGEEGEFEALTLISPDDYAAMDITYVSGEEVVEQTGELLEELSANATTAAEKAKLKRLVDLNARFDIYHFEEVVTGDPEDDEFMDPGCLLQVLQRLTELVSGIPVDPQTGSLI
jgi:hypothetical protein